jgi:proteasome beta subunit
MDQPLKTGTTTVGIVCKDAVILAADRKATAGNLIAHKKMKKLVKVSDMMALTTAGVVSDIQLLVKLLRAELSLKETQTSRKARVIEAANLLSGMCYRAIRQPTMIMTIASFMLGGADEEGVYLYDIEPAGSVMSHDDFNADGSGSVFALGVLEAEYKPNLSVEDGLELAKRAVNAAIQRDTASGCGIDIWIITKKGIEEKFAKTLQVSV